MKKLFLYALMLGGSFMCSGCAKENAASAYVGDGELVYLEKPGLFGSEGWKIVFNEFPLTKEYSGTYSFRGLPEIKKLDHYGAYLYIPSTLHGSDFDQAILGMELYADGILTSKFNAPMRQWGCMEISGYSIKEKAQGRGDGSEKNYYQFGMEIPADPNVRYELRVHYIPSSEVDGEETGHFYLSIGGSK